MSKLNIKSNEDANYFKMLINNLLDVLIEVELDGTVKYVNPQIHNLLGYQPEEFIGANIFHSIHPEDYSYFSKELKQSKRLKTSLSIEYRLQHKKGHYVPVYGRGTFFQTEGTTKVISIISDITERKKYQEELKKFRFIVESAQDAIFFKDLDNRYINANNKTIDAFGLSRKEVIGKNDLELMSNEKEARKNIEDDQEVFKTGKPKEITKQMTGINGKKIWFNAIKVPHFDKDGNLTGLVGIARDISEQMRAELRLKESEEKYRLITENANDLIAILNLNQKFEFEYINEQSYLNILGYMSDDIIGKNRWDIIHPDDLVYCINVLKDSVKYGEGMADYRLKHKKGHYIWVETKGKLFVDMEGKNKAILIGRDITDRKLIEQKLRDSEVKFRNLFENSPSSIILLDFKGVILDCNPTNEVLTGYCREELIGKRISDLFENPSEALPLLRERLKNLLEGKNPYLMEHQILRKDGITLWVNSLSSLIKFENSTFIQTTSQDITTKKEAEQKLKDSEKKYREAYNRAELYKDLFAHDINNILQNILSGIQLSCVYLDNKNELDDFTNYLKIMQEEVNRGANLVLNIRKVSQLETMDHSLEPTEINVVLKKSITIVKNTSIYRTIDITIDIPNEKLFIEANELLNDVFENILNNALRHNKNPVVKIQIKISKVQRENKNYIEMEFLDNGIGIDDSRKLEIFLRAEAKEKSTRGMGLGLSLVKKIVEMYNGVIHIEDRVKGDHTKGSNFILLFPEVGD